MSSRPTEKPCVLGFDQFGFAVFRRNCDKWKQEHRSHEYSYPSVDSSKLESWQKMLSNWNEAGASCMDKMHILLEDGVPIKLRGRLWKCLLDSDLVKESSTHTYQVMKFKRAKRTGLRGNISPSRGVCMCIWISLPQRTLDPWSLERSFPTHCSLMGKNPEAKEGQAKLFRILSAYAKYNPQIGYCQGMSYIAAMLLMNMQEEDAFWAFVVLLEKPKYLAGFYEHSLDTIQRHAKIFQQLLKHRMPCLWQHMDNLEVAPLLFITTWFLTLFTSLPCWDSVLAIWDLIILDGINVMFSTGLCILQLLEPRLLAMSDVSVLLPTLLRIPVDVSRYNVLVPALWLTKVHKWELDCMQSVVLEEEEEALLSSGKLSIQATTVEKMTKQNGKKTPDIKGADGKRSTRSSASVGKETLKDTLTKMLKIARCYLQDLRHLSEGHKETLSQEKALIIPGHSKRWSTTVNSKGQARRGISGKGRSEKTSR
ncbi:TBC1 domain family member 10A isoform X2 [Stegostoma tigrinum]|uniref:TBC1 domain family member 10A isoform X2 n=1 Tax=Stegostoma tigrinum TaxID=3053191 RepID=UPI00202B3F40|nr:TBC1 domain family member 10A isoform X2 [Stegostoma tigrinum]